MCMKEAINKYKVLIINSMGDETLALVTVGASLGIGKVSEFTTMVP